MTQSIPYWDRRIVLTIGNYVGIGLGLQVKDLRIAFKISKSLKPEPNKAEIKVWNLNQTNRLFLEQQAEATLIPVQLEVGYALGTSVIYQGELRSTNTIIDGPDYITTIGSGDKEDQCRKARCQVSFKRETTADQVILGVAKSLGVSEGNLTDAVKTLKFSTLGQLFAEGTVITGSAAREMTNLCHSVGLSWSIQDGKLQLIPLTKTLAGTAVKLTPSTGLVDSPSVDKKKVLSCKCLIQPDIIPGRLIVIESVNHSGGYRVEEVDYIGDTHGTDWYCDIKAKKY